MKRLLIALFMALATLGIQAQDLKFGYLSYDAALKGMPEYSIALTNVDKLRKQYDEELERAEKEFNSKYEDFLENQRTMAPAILDKRQAELQELLQKNLSFKAEAERLLKQAENDAYSPLRQKLNAAIKKIGMQRGYAFVLNTDNDACPYIDSTRGEDISVLVSDELK